MRTYIDNREDRRLSQWWLDPTLCQAGRRLSFTLGDSIDELSRWFCSPSVPLYSDKKLLIQIQQPTYNEKIWKAREAYINDFPNGDVPDDYDSLQHPDRACLSQVEWFASMWQTWTSMCNIHYTESARAFNCYSEKRQFRSLKRDRDILTSDNRLNSKRTMSHFFSSMSFETYDEHVGVGGCLSKDRESYESTRRSFIVGFGGAYAMAMSALPFSVQQTLTANIYELFDRMEPVMQYSNLPYVTSEIHLKSKQLCSYFKLWWVEFYDAYVHGLSPPFPYSLQERSMNVIRARMAEKELLGFGKDDSLKQLIELSKAPDVVVRIAAEATGNSTRPDVSRRDLWIINRGAPIYWPIAHTRGRYVRLWDWQVPVPYTCNLLDKEHMPNDEERLGA